MYFLKPSKFSFMLRHRLSKFETLRLFGFKIYGLYFLKGGSVMVDKIVLKPDETTIIDTSGNTAIVCVGTANQEIQVLDANDNYIGSIGAGEILTLPFNSGKYKLYYPDEAQWDALVFVARYFAI